VERDVNPERKTESSNTGNTGNPSVSAEGSANAPSGDPTTGGSTAESGVAKAPDDNEPPDNRHFLLRLSNHYPGCRQEVRIGRDEQIADLAALRARVTAALTLGIHRREILGLRAIRASGERLPIRTEDGWRSVRDLPDPIITILVTQKEASDAPAAPPDARPPRNDNGQTTDIYSGMDTQALRNECKEKGLSTEGNDAALRRQLRAKTKEESAEAEREAAAVEEQIKQLLAGEKWPPTQIEYERAQEDTIRLLQFCQSLQHPGEHVSSRADSNVKPSQLNEEGLRHVEDDPVVYEDGIDPEAQLDYDRLQGYLEDPECQWRSVADAYALLRQRLGHDKPHSIIYEMPRRLSASLSAEDDSDRRHKLYQICFLAWAITREERYGGGLCADHMGMGKTREYVAMMSSSMDSGLRIGRLSL
jgi:hypothetical protein